MTKKIFLIAWYSFFILYSPTLLAMDDDISGSELSSSSANEPKSTKKHKKSRSVVYIKASAKQIAPQINTSDSNSSPSNSSGNSQKSNSPAVSIQSTLTTREHAMKAQLLHLQNELSSKIRQNNQQLIQSQYQNVNNNWYRPSNNGYNNAHNLNHNNRQSYYPNYNIHSPPPIYHEHSTPNVNAAQQPIMENIVLDPPTDNMTKLLNNTSEVAKHFHILSETLFKSNPNTPTIVTIDEDKELNDDSQYVEVNNINISSFPDTDTINLENNPSVVYYSTPEAEKLGDVRQSQIHQSSEEDNSDNDEISTTEDLDYQNDAIDTSTITTSSSSIIASMEEKKHIILGFLTILILSYIVQQGGYFDISDSLEENSEKEPIKQDNPENKPKKKPIPHKTQNKNIWPYSLFFQ